MRHCFLVKNMMHIIMSSYKQRESSSFLLLGDKTSRNMPMVYVMITDSDFTAEQRTIKCDTAL